MVNCAKCGKELLHVEAGYDKYFCNDLCAEDKSITKLVIAFDSEWKYHQTIINSIIEKCKKDGMDYCFEKNR